ncbi:toxin-antitoxin system YwqK family antitoxin [Flavobacterium hiemivividum]|uniref:Toxin-antitoxin system YwqK family antitoxin n=1 Tax=Flavobacterium hiemivividum TaxID=2541734 RepID=A0A4R5CV89_9FLAO|nr:hypothetical protein [Flavobacterium hiemivividum]TDE03587.1 hypothetical protein E0F98_10960 [Flavobacterium hiemivividum]
MKNLSLLIIIFFLTFTSCTIQKDFYQNGNLEAKGKITQDIKHGKWKYFYKNGNLHQIGKYSNGMKTGEWKMFHTNGNLEAIGTFIEGVRVGVWKSYHNSGTIYTEKEWDNGMLTKTIACYDEEGYKVNKNTFSGSTESKKASDISSTLNFIIHGIDNKVPQEYLNFKTKYGIGLIIENCAVDPFSFSRASKNNRMISEYLNTKYGKAWLNELSLKPYGI